MSVDVRVCDGCNEAMVFDGMGLVPKRNDRLFGVAWKCPKCSKKALDMCPIGPIVPAPGLCLNCGGILTVDSAATCLACGMSRAQTLEFFRIDQDWSTEAAIEVARQAFAPGLCRLGLGILNYVLQKDPSIEEAWVIKYQVYQMLKMDTSALQEFETAAGRIVERGNWA